MKWLIFFGAIVFVSLFLVTTFSKSSAAEAEARTYFSADEIEWGLQYSFERRLLFWPAFAVKLGILVALVTTSIARKSTDWLQRRVGGRWLPTVLLVGLCCFFGSELISLPFAIANFELAGAWGLTKRSLADWFGDYLAGLGVAAVTDGVTLVGLYVLLRWLPRRWWLAATFGGTALGVAYAILAPVLIEPIFNTFTPLGQTPWAYLESRVRALAQEGGVPVRDIYVIDASRQGFHSNAYFTGFGATQRIVLYDNLLKKCTPDEVASVLAHEIGHWQQRHIMKGIALGAVGSMIGLFILAQFLRVAVGRGELGLRSPSDPAGLPLILLLFILGQWLSMPVVNGISRFFERQADQVSLDLARQPDAFITAEKRLAIDNVGNVAPLPFSVWFFGSHPPPVERIRMAEQWRQHP
jgi:STE24 endopeptidase